MDIDRALLNLISRFPTGFYLCELEKFEGNFRDFSFAFSKHYANTCIAYSYKTNYLPAFCRAVNRLGGYAEVVSGTEFKIARKLGIKGSRIIFNGPFKLDEELLEAASCGTRINLECDTEIDRVVHLAMNTSGVHFNVGLRCAINLEGAEPSRFGFDIEAPEFPDRVERLLQASNITLKGLHCHSIPPGRTADSYARVTRQLANLGREIWGLRGPDYIDIGGGFYSNMSPEMRQQFGHSIPAFSDYGKAVSAVMNELFNDVHKPELILEPGLALVADAMSFVCKVHEIKRSGERELALVGASVYNIKPTKSSRNLPVRKLGACQETQRDQESVRIVGYTCMEDDVLHTGFKQKLAVGDALLFSNVGAYTLVLKPPFIQGNAPVVALDELTGTHKIMKRPETVDDFLSSYVLT